MSRTQYEIAREIRSLLDDTGRRYAEFAVIPDVLFYEANDEIERGCDLLGISRKRGDHIILDQRTRLVGEMAAGRILAKYYQIVGIVR